MACFLTTYSLPGTRTVRHPLPVRPQLAGDGRAQRDPAAPRVPRARAGGGRRTGALLPGATLAGAAATSAHR